MIKSIEKRSILKDRAKGALTGRYRQYILTSVVVFLMTLFIRSIVEFTASMASSACLLATNPQLALLSTDQMLELFQSPDFQNNLSTFYRPIYYVLYTISQIFTSLFTVGTLYISLKIACGMRFTLSDLFIAYRRNFGKLFCVASVYVLLNQLYAIPSFLLGGIDYRSEIPLRETGILLASLLFGALIYTMIYLNLSQVFFLSMDFPNLRTRDWFQKSIQMMRGHRFRFLLLELSFFPLMLLSLLTLGIGDLWLTPYMQVTSALFYLNLMQINTAS